MPSIFCCSKTQPYKDHVLAHESKFRSFTTWGVYPADSSVRDSGLNSSDDAFVIQVVRQVNFGPLESKRYFLRLGIDAFAEVGEQWLIDHNFQKLNAYKNLKCALHNKFFELNVYEKNPVNKHHWRVNVARPGTQIDL